MMMAIPSRKCKGKTIWTVRWKHLTAKKTTAIKKAAPFPERLSALVKGIILIIRLTNQFVLLFR